jgi:hypothetical protein
VLEVRPEAGDELEAHLGGLPLGRLGEVTDGHGDGGGSAPRLIIQGIDGRAVVDAAVDELKAAWQGPLRWP